MATRDRCRGALLGLAVGDAMGAPTEGMTPDGIHAAFGRVEDFLSAEAAGTDDTEYAVLCAQGLLAHGHGLTSNDVAEVWGRALLAQREGFHGAGFSEMVAIANLRAGVLPPVSGNDNYESWSDGAAMRVAPIGLLCAGDPGEAARLAAEDARVSHSADGIFGAQAIAAAVARALVTDDHTEVVAAGLAAVPEDSWTGRLMRRALDVASASPTLEVAERDLYRDVPLFHYPWPDSAPEAVALAFGLFAAARGTFVPSVVSAVNIGRDSDTIAAMAGAMAGALHGESAIPERWRDTVRRVAGVCVTVTGGTDLVDLADALHAAHGNKEYDIAR
ncbi:ADP-ribosylglycohydrolase family protein [Nocardiopsis sp. MG754419]|uniref:ADP-ribosylglycohydrolase family protein n=1 Tax=Nocardiopsis sp. MG754419 TaxID=2259865 RepID=UPI002011F847|nr:ADP-ribosylglycohydrolase family protein [Nocardiopsis sp. MG754419]MBR8742110.1 crystallin J1 [Nocardiopsis sp. MG754419]